ncbi:MAG: CopD family protein [Gammaproteobacteria bacterium]
MSIAITLHLLSAVLWVGGMFFAYMVLRPVAANLLEPPLRLPLWTQCFKAFFPWVWLFALTLPVTGYWMIFKVFGGMSSVGLYVHIMHGLGWVMILIFAHLFFAPYKRLKTAVAASDWPVAGAQLNTIRKMIGINLLIGLTTIIVGVFGKYI